MRACPPTRAPTLSASASQWAGSRVCRSTHPRRRRCRRHRRRRRRRYAPLRSLEEVLASAEMRRIVSRPFSSWNRPILTEIYLCHACSCHETLRVKTAGQELPEQLVDALPTSGDVKQLAEDWRPMLDALRVGDSEAAVKAADAFMSRGVVAEKKAATVRSWLSRPSQWGGGGLRPLPWLWHARQALADQFLADRMVRPPAAPPTHPPRRTRRARRRRRRRWHACEGATAVASFLAAAVTEIYSNTYVPSVPVKKY
eukprot:COSAG01_NODE_440_length_17033_cov_16.301110_8_plen_256_part_00